MQHTKDFIDENFAQAEISKILTRLGLAGISKKSGTYGGEYTSPCPLCRLKDGYGGTKRLQWHPARPYFGRGSKLEPFFWCRDCNQSGDLINMYARVHNVSFAEAMAYYEIKEYVHRESGREVTMDDPHITSQKKPVEIWQARAWTLVDECAAALFAPEGAAALRYLMEQRRVTEETIRYLKWGFQEVTRRWDLPEMWGYAPEDKKVRVHMGILMPELHVNPETGELDIYSLEIRRSEEDMLEEEIERGVRQYKYNFVRGGSRGLYAIGLQRGKPLSLNEGKINAAIAWQEGRDEFAAAATQSKDGALDNVATVMPVLNKPNVILLTQEGDAGGCVAAVKWAGYLKNSLIHHPPEQMDLNEYHVAGHSVYDFLLAGVERYQKRSQRTDDSRLNAILGTLNSRQVLSPYQADQGPPTVTTAPKNDFVEAWNESWKQRAEEYKRADAADKSGPAVFTEDAVLSRQDEAELSCEQEEDQSCPDDIEEPSTGIVAPNLGACPRCGEPGIYVDPQGEAWCGKDVAAFRLMRDGAHRSVMYSQMYLGKPGVISLPRRGEDGVYTLQALPCERTEVANGRGPWRKFCQEASEGDLWRAATEVHQIIFGFTPRYKPVGAAALIRTQCARIACKHDAAKPHRYNEDRLKDEDGNETRKYRYPLYQPHQVTIGGVAYVFCPHCLTAAYLLELAHDLDYSSLDVGHGVIVGEDGWLKFCRESSLFLISWAFEPLRRNNVNVWQKTRQEIG